MCCLCNRERVLTCSLRRGGCEVPGALDDAGEQKAEVRRSQLDLSR